MLKKSFIFLIFILGILLPAIPAQAAETVNVTAIPRSDPASRTGIEQRSYRHSSFEVTGIFLPQGEEVIVEVEEEPENAQLMIGQWGEYTGVENITNGKLDFGSGTFKLEKGENRFANTKTGGMVYINNLSDTQTLHVKVTGGRKVPLYIQGTTDIDTFKTELTNAQDVPFMELVNEKVIATVRIDRTKAIFLKNSQADDFLTYAKEIVDLENQVADLSMEGSYSSNKARQRLHIANPTAGAGSLYCTNYYLGIHSKSNSDLSVFNSKSGQSSWGLFHEIGHSYQNPYYTWNDMGEVTVNIYANYVNGHLPGINSPYDAVENKTKNNYYRSAVKRYFDNKAKDATWTLEKEIAANRSNYHFGALGMYVGLERAFGDDFYQMLNRLYRTMPDSQLPTSNLDKQQFFVIQTSKLTKTDLTPYFDFWGITITEKTRKELDSLGYPVLEKEIWKDLLATEAEEKAGTYRISKQVQAVKSYPRATPLNDVTELKAQELNRLDIKKYFTDLHSEPTPSEVTSITIEETDFWQLSTRTTKAFLKNELGIGERIEFKVKVVPQDTYVMSGQRGVYMILDYDKVNQELVAKGRNVKIVEGLPNNIYPIVTIYNENFEMKKEVTGTGNTYGNQLASQLDKEKLAVGDIVKIYHKEASKRSMRYINGSKVTTSQDTYYYKITPEGWQPIVPKPTGSGVERTIRIGEEVTADDMVTATDPVIGKQLKVAWSKPPIYAGNFGKDDLINTQEVSVKLTNAAAENTWIFTNLIIKRGNSLKITGEAHKEKISMVVNEKQQLKVYGAASSFHNGKYKEENYNQIQIFTKNGTLKKAVTSLGKDTGASAAEQLHNMQLAVGDYLMVIPAEGTSHLFAYEQDKAVPKKNASGDIITYQVTEDGWEQVVVQPQVTSKNQTVQIGQAPTANDFVSASDYLFGNELLSFRWGANQPKTLSKGVSLSDYLQQQVAIEPLVSRTPMNQVSASLTYRLNNTINIARHGGFGTFITYEPRTQKLIAQGADPYTLNGSNKDTQTPLVTIEVFYQAAEKEPYQLKAFNNTQASELTDSINNAKLKLEVGDIVKITHARQNQAGLNLDADTQKYVTKAMTAFIDHQKIDQFSGPNQYYLVTPTGLELHQDASDLIGKVMVHYVDEKGQPLQTPAELTGELGQSFTMTVPTFDTYQLKEAPSALTGTFTRSQQEYTFIYERKAGGDITVQYKDEQGNQLADEEVLQGKLVEPYQATAKIITGYQLKSVPKEQQGTFSEAAKTLIFVYEPVAAAPITINYQDENGTEIAAPETLTGKFNEAYQVHPKTLDGWILKEQPAAASGTFTLSPQTLIFIYERAQGQTVYVQYLNEKQEVIAPTETLTGKVGEKYQTQAKDIAGWILKEQPANAAGTFTAEVQYVNYLYDEVIQGEVHVYYQDSEGTNLAPAETIKGTVGTAYEVTAKEIATYTLKETIGTTSGTYAEQVQEVYFNYERAAAVPIMVNYIDIESKEILETTTLTGKIGDPYSIELKQIPGYTLVVEAIQQRSTFIRGVFGEQQPAEILITYRKNTAEQPNVDSDDTEQPEKIDDAATPPQEPEDKEKESTILTKFKVKPAESNPEQQLAKNKHTGEPKNSNGTNATLPKTNEEQSSWSDTIIRLNSLLFLAVALLQIRLKNKDQLK